MQANGSGVVALYGAEDVAHPVSFVIAVFSGLLEF
jgi:hypothetical protein